MKIETKFTFDKVDHTKENDIHAVVSLKAPSIDWQEKRKPICVVPVIDVSGSMSGQKLEYAKNSVLKLIEHLQPGDYCGVVAFDNQVFEIASLREMTQAQKDDMRAKVGALHVGGSTNFAGGLRRGLEWVNQADLPNDMLLRVIMLTDGHANAGEAQGRNLLPFQKKHLGRATVSCFGYGTDCDQDLLADLAKEGGGNYIFVRNPDDALTAFARELGGLLSRYAQDVVVDIAPFNGHVIEQVLSDVDVEEDAGKVKITIPEILAEEERHLVLKVKTSEQSKALPREMNVLDIKVAYELVKKGDNEKCTEELKGKLRFVKPGEEQTEPTREVMEIVGIAMTVQAQIKAEEEAKTGNFAGAQAALSANAGVLRSAGLSAQASASEAVGMYYNSAGSYTASAGQRRSIHRGMAGGQSLSNDAEVGSVLNQVGANYGNAVMDFMEASFKAPVEAPKEEPPKVEAKAPAKKKVAKKRSKRW